ncbi:MAG TPA: hypothetical protein DCP47_03095 [Phycisphaerales bacterium]|nr:hypothetical protein [Phycisphaerales bacterium]
MSDNIAAMDVNHSKGMKKSIFAIGGMAILLFQSLAFGLIYTSFGTSVGKSFGLPEEKNVKIETQLYVPVSGKIRDLNISLDLKHTSFCDLSISIKSPNGTSAMISLYDVTNFVKDKQSFGWITLDNESTIKIDTAFNLSVGSFLPTGPNPISKFYSQQCLGMWKITVCDLVYYDTGTLDGIRFDMAIDPTISALSIPEPSTLIFSITSLIIFFKTKH